MAYWYLQLAVKLEDAPWPANKAELLDYAERNGLPQQVMENISELEDDDYVYEDITDIWPEYVDWIDFQLDDYEE